jgi:integrase/recombinase XerD
MTPIAPHITAFLRERLPLQRGASEHTCDSYAYAFQLLFEFAGKRLRLTPSALSVATQNDVGPDAQSRGLSDAN